LLTAIVILSGLASLIGTQLLVDTFRSSAVRVERETTISATLRADVVAHVVAVASPITGDQQRQVDALQTAVRAGFTQAIGDETTTAAKELLRQSLAEWQAVVDAAGPPDARADQATMGAAVSARAPKVLDLLDQAGSTSRAAVRVDLANAARLDHQVMIVLAVLELLAVGLAVRLARRLSTEVLRPVGILRDSANHLAAGRLDHRVVVDRADELGELAVSFNAMADAIAGSQRSLTREANTDSLTGLANRAAFRARLEATLAS
jgi:nitrate/nitrite-specific signal transduction histidine kinase